MLSINTNLMAQRASNYLNSHYGRLAQSARNLSSGLRINFAADDASGLTVRELMRTDVAALNQGIRNASDAISMIQVADGALGVIDEKLIRMKELAEQAATGTYDSTQRLLIDAEFQAMGEEIDRIARATDFNGIKLLDYDGERTDGSAGGIIKNLSVTDSGSVSNLRFLPENSGSVQLIGFNPVNYINENCPTLTLPIELNTWRFEIDDSGKLTKISEGEITSGPTTFKEIVYDLSLPDLDTATIEVVMGDADDLIIDYNAHNWGWNNNGWTISDGGQAYDLRIDPTGEQMMAIGQGFSSALIFSMTDDNGNSVNFNDFAQTHNYEFITIDTGSGEIDAKHSVVDVVNSNPDYEAHYDEDSQTLTVNMAKGGQIVLHVDDPLPWVNTIAFDLNFAADVEEFEQEAGSGIPPDKIKIHFGPMNDAAEDYYYIDKHDATRVGLGLDGVKIQTQDEAQAALVTVNKAITDKDAIRAEYGAMQNRLENTISNLSIQAENLQVAESRISDADVAVEMTKFVRNQVLTQSALAMLAQANSMPQIAMRLIGG